MDAPWLLPTLWALVPLAVFCIARSRLPLYILPLFAPLALLATLQSVRDGRAMPRLAWMAGWAVVMFALKLGSAHFPTHKNARDWAAEIRTRTQAPISEVLFVEDMARYGVHLHLGQNVQVEKFSIDPVADAKFNPEYDGSIATGLRRQQPDQLWVCRQENFADIAARVRAAGFEPQVLGTPYQGRVFFRTARR
ncbi:hypothetical protein FW784_13490 [Lysobacter lacus]|uniref:Uncharacterized protein n=1 Tax=Cognatilysobacter lacus TaxID=1643323 RepID=A0A5D8YJD6_9GAMM|nr:hypothetical protein FW784_13490 [Lysobacter lacus]